MKNLNFTKHTAVLVGGFVLSQAVIYTGFVAGTGLKPFEKNQYEVHRFDIIEYGKDGIVTSELYQSDMNLQTSFVIKKPYCENKEGEFEREVYRIPVDFYSNVEIEYVLNHIGDQKLLLEQDYVQEMVEGIQNQPNDFALFNKETIEELPKDNDYEISYALFYEDNDDVKMTESTLMDFLVTNMYLIFAIGGAEITTYTSNYLMKRKTKEDIH